MAIKQDTKNLTDYVPGALPTLGNPERFLSAELAKVSKSVRKLIEVMQLLEARMNSNGLS